MKLFSFFKTHSVLIIYVAFIILHLLLTNVNSAEWGDSYRILRASEHIRQGNYPLDEKRPPLYSLLLSVRPATVDPIVWGRVFMLALSVAALFIFDKLFNQLSNTPKARALALLMFILNPVYLYWSLRIYADVLFSIEVMFALYLYLKWREKLTCLKVGVLGLFAALAVLTRFEGYILFGALGFGLVYLNRFNTDFAKSFIKNIRYICIYVISFILILLPYYLWRNPLTSSYFEEPTGRTYDLSTLAIYIVSLLFLFGFVYAGFFYWEYKDKFKEYLLNTPAIALFIILELLLVLVWPAAIPRLFIPVIPLLIIPLADYINTYFSLGNKYWSTIRSFFTKSAFNYRIVLLIVLPLVYVCAQIIFRLQFLIVQKYVLLFILLLQVVLFASIITKKKMLFFNTFVVSMLVWSLATIYQHKDIYKGVAEVSKFASERVCGVVAYNDVSSVSDWYLNESSGIAKNCENRGIYYDATVKTNRSKESLQKSHIAYILVTNEHNTTLTFDTTEWPHIVSVYGVDYAINGKTFFTNLYKVIYE